MWPLDLLQKRIHQRRHKAAIVVLLGANIGSYLTASTQEQVEAETDANFNRCDTPAAAWRCSEPWYVIGAFRACAMERLGIAPPIATLSWSELLPPRYSWDQTHKWYSGADFDGRATVLLRNFRQLHRATEHAATFLRSNGIPIPNTGLPTLSSDHALQADAPLNASDCERWLAFNKAAMRHPNVPDPLADALELVARERALWVAYDTHYDAGNAELRWWSGKTLNRLDFQPFPGKDVKVTHLTDTYSTLPRLLRWAWTYIPMFPYLAKTAHRALGSVPPEGRTSDYATKVREFLARTRRV